MLQTKIKEYRAKYNLSQDELAEKVNARRETINRLEKGLYNPSLKLALDISKYIFNNKYI
jgi:putative transcriptional regulator